MTNDYALVLTGEVLPGFESGFVWPQLAAHFRTEPQKLAQLLAHAPRTIKQDGDLDKLRGLQAGIMQIGAQTEIFPAGERPALHVMINGTPRGPMPRALVQRRIEQGQWADSISVQEAGASEWKPYRELNAAAKSSPATGKLALSSDDEQETNSDATGILSVLPEGVAIYAGFWRRCAAMGLDGLILALASPVLFILASVIGYIFGAGKGDMGSIVLLGVAQFFTLVLIIFVGFLYFPWMQSSQTQATFGMRIFGIKMIDKYGRRILLRRAILRFLPMATIGVAIYLLLIFSGFFLIDYTRHLNAGQGRFVIPSADDFLPIQIAANIAIPLSIIWFICYIMAGLTKRKQTLYEILTGTFIVFDDVKPSRPYALTQQPPMPMYGWMLSILSVACISMPIILAIAIPKEITAIQEAMIQEAHDRPIRNRNRPINDRIYNAVEAMEDSKAMEYDVKISARKCLPGEYSIPEDPTLGTVKVVNEGSGVCSAVITFAKSDDLPFDLHDGKIMLMNDGYWHCSSTLPEKYLPPSCK